MSLRRMMSRSARASPAAPARERPADASAGDGAPADASAGTGAPADAPASDDAAQARLLAAVAAGDQQALAALYDHYAQPLYAFGVRRLGDPGLAEELVQQVLLRVWRHADQYDAQRGSVRTWVLAIARNATVDLHRRRRREPAVQALPEQLSRGVADELEQLVRAETVRAGLDRLSPEHRRVLELAYFAGLTQAEVAEHLALPLGTVKSRTYYALKALRLALEELGERP